MRKKLSTINPNTLMSFISISYLEMGTRIKPNVFSSIAVRIAQDIAVVNKIIERIVCMPMDPACNVLSVLYKPFKTACIIMVATLSSVSVMNA